MNEFKNRTAVVTGAAQGMGRAVVKEMLSQGAVVIAIDRNENMLTSLMELPNAKSNLRIYGKDISDYSGLYSIIIKEDKISPIEYLVNAAGILEPASLMKISPDQWDNTINVNLKGTFFLTQMVATQMVARKRGSIVTVSSNSSGTPRSNMGSYPISKAALTHSMKCLALETAESGLRINTISPGSTDTPMQRSFQKNGNDFSAVIDGNPGAYRLGIPLKKMGTVEDVVNGVLFFLSEKSGHITMENLTIDGGATLGIS